MGNIDIGKAFSDGWEIFSKCMAPLILGTLIAALLNFGILMPIFVGGLYIMIKKTADGQTATVGDIFSGFSNFLPLFIAGIFVFLLALGGMLACCIGLFFTMAIVLFIYPLVIDKGLSGTEAMSESWAAFKDNIWGFVIFNLIISFVAGAGSAVAVGYLFTYPFALCVTWAGYKQVFGEGVSIEQRDPVDISSTQPPPPPQG